MPPYASAMFFELHQVNGKFHVELYNKRELGEDKVPLEPLYIPNCGQKCPLNKFYDLYQDILPTEDFDTECRLPFAYSLFYDIKTIDSGAAAGK